MSAYDRLVVRLRVVATHRPTRLSRDRDGMCRQHCMCGWAGSPWDHAEVARDHQRAHVIEEFEKEGKSHGNQV